jgi:hypothetical protein
LESVGAVIVPVRTVDAVTVTVTVTTETSSSASYAAAAASKSSLIYSNEFHVA